MLLAYLVFHWRWALFFILILCLNEFVWETSMWNILCFQNQISYSHVFKQNAFRIHIYVI